MVRSSAATALSGRIWRSLVVGANIAAPSVDSVGDLMVPELQVPDSRFPPDAPIPGRGLPQPEILQIPTRQVRLVRACGAFVTSLAAAGTLALGPAVVAAEFGGGARVLVAPSSAPQQLIPVAASAREPFVRWLVHRPRNDLRARSTVVVAGGSGSPRGRDDGVMMPWCRPGLGNGAAARFAGRQLRQRPGAGEVLALSRRPRPPPVAGGKTPHHFGALIAFNPASSPPDRWRQPVFLSSRI